jgi:hypothetical protein
MKGKKNVIRKKEVGVSEKGRQTQKKYGML